MSRARVRDNSNPVQLFPFVAVLLCTMGSLLVILVVVARCSWDHGAQQAAAEKRTSAEVPTPNDDVRQKLTAVHGYVEQLATVRTQAEQKLQSDQKQLSHLEDHMRRLQNQLDSLRLAAGELDGLEREHYDDRAQAEREVARLRQLIDDTKKDIDGLKKVGNGKPRSYAIVPFVGRNGTRRPPIYLECRGKEVILQPEGIHLTDDDFVPELGPGSPLAAGLRAAREYVISQYGAATGAEPEPYPLLLVRPKGEYGFYESRALFEKCGIQFGYELVDGNWELKYPPANPELAARETQAIELARGRVKALAAAAPGMLRRDRDDDDDDGDLHDDFAGGPVDYNGNSVGRGGTGGDGAEGDGGSDLADERYRSGGALGTGHGGGPGVADGGQVIGSPFFAASGGGSPQGGGGPIAGGGADSPTANGTNASGSPSGGSAAAESPGSALPNLMADARGGGSDGPSGAGSPSLGGGPSLSAGTGATSAMSGGSGGYNSGSNGYSSESGSPPSGALVGESAPRSPGAAIIGPADGSSTAAAAVTVGRGSTRGGSPIEDDDEPRPPVPAGPGMYQERPSERIVAKSTDDKPVEKRHARGKNWALVDANSQATPIRRTIQIVVRGDRVAVLPEGASAASGAAGGHEIPLNGSSREAYEPFMMALETQIKDWGMAGRGLYWRPVLEVNVGPDGQQRAADITRLLKNSGIELRAASAVATQNQGTSTGASSSR
jgi:hypothetical protein